MAADIEKLRIKDERLKRVLEGEGFLVFDGGLGTMIQKAGLAGAANPPDLLNLTDPEAIEKIARAYVEAGSDVITTNTFSSNAMKLAGKASVEEVYAAAARIARSAGARYVAGDIGPTGVLIEPLGTLSFDDAYDLFAEQARAADAAGCDLIVVETMADLREAKAAVLAATENTDLPVFATMTFSESGRTFLGTTPAIAAASLSSMGVAAVGVNCSLGPDRLVDVVGEMSRFARCPVMAQPNAGLPRMVDGETVYDIDPVAFAQSMEGIIAAGASIVGGCCGTSPDFIARLRSLVDGVQPKARAWERSLTVASAQSMVVMPECCDDVAAVADFIDMAGDEDLAAALRAGDYDDIASEASDQEEEGARILGVGACLPGVAEPEALRELIAELQGMVSLPLRIDSRDPLAIEAAVRGCAGKPLVGPVDGRGERLEAMLSLVRAHGCCMIASPSDEDGVPAAAEDRLRIAERIVAAAEQAGVPRCDIVVDCSAGSEIGSRPEADAAVRAVSLCKRRLGVRTTLAIPSEESGAFACPDEAVGFLVSALEAGLDLPVFDLRSERYREAVEALEAQKRSCAS